MKMGGYFYTQNHEYMDGTPMVPMTTSTPNGHHHHDHDHGCLSQIVSHNELLSAIAREPFVVIDWYFL